ncbi:hypothetical protein ACFWMS_17800 [Peribacillus butanolivorans]|uniref:hypothetical protein n=1 Tax=Peribacillus butanolivorans TaxID=421767 RepID=UPI00365C8A90
MNLMNTEWIEIEDMFKVREYSETWKKNYRGILRKLKAEYPTGDNWLKTPIEEKEHIIIWRNYNDSRYILSWALERGLMDHPEYRKAIIDYYSKFYNSVGGISKELAQYYKFVTEEEAEALKELRKKGSEKVVFVNSFLKQNCLNHNVYGDSFLHFHKTKTGKHHDVKISKNAIEWVKQLQRVAPTEPIEIKSELYKGGDDIKAKRLVAGASRSLLFFQPILVIISKSYKRRSGKRTLRQVVGTSHLMI